MKKIFLLGLLFLTFLGAEELTDSQKQMMQNRERTYNLQDSSQNLEQNKYQKQNQYQHKYQYKKGDGESSGSGNMYKGSKGNGGGGKH